MKSVYLDASVLVAIFSTDAFSERALVWLAANPVPLQVSNFAAAEFASALGRLVRMGQMQASDAIAACIRLDTWMEQATERVEVTAADIRMAEGFLRRFDQTLRTPDAMHLSATLRLSASLATFDRDLAACASKLGGEVVAI
ncbi:type II toxin-antitoxin system VapC family toxin [Phenylobacterium sp.]|uniref:type II toxin-antitoxin system VapC family toxin n=1 Tax=Phenylobacterium sp. TaxID=1871053 RepID=UPI0025F7243B|nr:type II toxin-antitoxin system VapC family toxin [Phenylobacterium sp.]